MTLGQFNIDPASPEFELLSPKKKANVWYFDIGWDEKAIADELDRPVKDVVRWLDSEVMKDSKPLRNLNKKSSREKNDYSLLFDLIRTGLNQKAIMAKTGLSRNTIYKALKRHHGGGITALRQQIGE